jgi:hypothetical protein
MSKAVPSAIIPRSPTTAVATAIVPPFLGPKCQGAAAREWLAKRQEDLLPIGYFHVVFTLPSEIGDIAWYNKTVIYDLLFKAASQTLMTIAADPRVCQEKLEA